jgi:hypothetical protein
MREQLVGAFNLGYENVRLVVREGVGGEFVTGPVPTISIGIQAADWSLVYESLYHECHEFAAFRTGSRYTPDNSMSSDHGYYFFAYSHTTFSDICGRVTAFMIPALPVLRQAWQAYHSPRKSTKKRR